MSEQDMNAPLIVTLALDAASQERFDALRRQHFPVARNHLRAHVTLFHALPGTELESVRATLGAAAQRGPFAVAVTGVRFLGAGVAYELASPELARVRADLAGDWEPWLTRQDQQPFRPHVTVQNKVASEQARALQVELTAGFMPYGVEAQGLQLWHYLGGPWRHDSTFEFR